MKAIQIKMRLTRRFRRGGGIAGSGGEPGLSGTYLSLSGLQTGNIHSLEAQIACGVGLYSVFHP
jgi:hypothetical protein